MPDYGFLRYKYHPVWNNLINNRTGSKLEGFNKYLWNTECSNSNTPKQTNYYKFANAAILQYKFVEKFIENKIPTRSARPFNIIGDRSNKGSLENGVLKVGMPLQVIRNGQTIDFCSGIIPGIEWIKLETTIL